MNTYWNIRSILHKTKQLKDIIARRNGGTRFSHMIQNIDRHVLSSWFFVLSNIVNILLFKPSWDRRDRDRMTIGFITTYAISAYHH